MMIRFKTGFVLEYLVRDYLGLDLKYDAFNLLLFFSPNSWRDFLVLNLYFYSL